MSLIDGFVLNFHQKQVTWTKKIKLQNEGFKDTNILRKLISGFPGNVKSKNLRKMS